MSDEIKYKLLPIGTVVKVAGKDNKIMICGRQQIDLETEEEFDYIGCEYPEGLDGEKVVLFNVENIIMIYFLGYQDFDEVHQKFVLLGNMNEND